MWARQPKRCSQRRGEVGRPEQERDEHDRGHGGIAGRAVDPGAHQPAVIDAEQQEDGTEIARLHQRLEEIDGYAARSRAARLMHGLGFGIDGDEQTKEADFEAIRGTYDGNSFVKNLRKDITEIETKAANLSRILSME